VRVRLIMCYTTGVSSIAKCLKSQYGVLTVVGSCRNGLLDSRQTFINFIFIHKLVGRSLARGMDFTRQRSNYIINEGLVIR